MRRNQSLFAIALTVLTLSCFAVVLVGQAAGRSSSIPSAWPFGRLQLGLMNGPGEAGAMESSAPLRIRYQYLSGGVNTGASWQQWAQGGLSYVKEYISESEDHDLLPVFSYYQLRQSLPGANDSQESVADLSNLKNVSTMSSYYQDLIAFFKAASSAHGQVVLHFEPDAFGYIEQAATGNDASTVPAAVASTGILGLSGLPNTAAGWAQAVVKLRDDYAPNVILAYADSIWGTGLDIHLNHPSGATTASMAAKSVAFYDSLHADFDMVFTEVGNEDAGQVQTQQGTDSAWWHPVDFARDAEYLRDFHNRVTKPIAIWQIPLGNTIMRAVNNTPCHWQDNRVQWYLGQDSAAHREQLVNAGVVALLFGSAQPNGTSALDTGSNGIRNPPPINDNVRDSYSEADDGGYFMKQAGAFYSRDVLKVAG